MTIKCRVCAILRFFFRTFPILRPDNGGIFPSKHFLVTKYVLQKTVLEAQKYFHDLTRSAFVAASTYNPSFEKTIQNEKIRIITYNPTILKSFRRIFPTWKDRKTDKTFLHTCISSIVSRHWISLDTKKKKREREKGKEERKLFIELSGRGAGVGIQVGIPGTENSGRALK